MVCVLRIHGTPIGGTSSLDFRLLAEDPKYRRLVSEWQSATAALCNCSTGQVPGFAGYVDNTRRLMEDYASSAK